MKNYNNCKKNKQKHKSERIKASIKKSDTKSDTKEDTRWQISAEESPAPAELMKLPGVVTTLLTGRKTHRDTIRPIFNKIFIRLISIYYHSSEE